MDVDCWAKIPEGKGKAIHATNEDIQMVCSKFVILQFGITKNRLQNENGLGKSIW
jgi:hypothetical protein